MGHCVAQAGTIVRAFCSEPFAARLICTMAAARPLQRCTSPGSRVADQTRFCRIHKRRTLCIAYEKRREHSCKSCVTIAASILSSARTIIHSLPEAGQEISPISFTTTHGQSNGSRSIRAAMAPPTVPHAPAEHWRSDADRLGTCPRPCAGLCRQQQHQRHSPRQLLRNLHDPRKSH